MSEEKTDNKSADLKDDVVPREDYNKVVESHNSLKAEKERLEKQMKEKSIEEQKASWEKENEELKKQNEELKKIAEEKKETKVSKGIVNEPKKEVQPVEQAKKLLDEKIPDRKVNPEKFGSAIQRYAHYKSGATKQYTDDQLGMGLSLHGSAQRIEPDLVRHARDRLPGQEEIILRK